MWNLILKSDKMNLIQNRKLTDPENELMGTKGEMQCGREKSGAWDQCTHTPIYKIYNQ